MLVARVILAAAALTARPAVVAGPGDVAHPEGLAVDASGRLLIADRMNNRIRVLAPGEPIATLADESPRSTGGFGGTMLPPTFDVEMLAIDPDGDLLFASRNSRFVHRRDARTGKVARAVALPFGPGGPEVAGLACDRAGNAYLAFGERVFRVAPRSDELVLVAGTGRHGFFGDGGPARDADLGRPGALAVDASGVLYIADSANHRIRAVDRKGRIRTVAGNGRVAPFVEGDALRNPVGEVLALVVDARGDVLFMDHRRCLRRLRVRECRLESILDRPDDTWDRRGATPGLALGPDGTLYFAIPHEDRVEAIAPGASR